MNWQIELLTSPVIRLVFAALLVTVAAACLAAAWAFRRLRQWAAGSPRSQTLRG